MTNFLIGCALGAFFVVCVGIPFIAPWPVRVRYLVSAQLADPVLGLAPLPRLTMREVTVSAVDARGGHVELVIDEVGPSSSSLRHGMLTRDRCAASVIARLDGWAALHTPLLLIVDEDASSHLYGPDGSVTNLGSEKERIK